MQAPHTCIASRPPPMPLRQRVPLPHQPPSSAPQLRFSIESNTLDLITFLLDYDRVHRRTSSLDNLEGCCHVEERPLVIRRAVFG